MGDLADLIAQHAKFATSPLIAKLFNEGASRIENLEIEQRPAALPEVASVWRFNGRMPVLPWSQCLKALLPPSGRPSRR